jgi:hypothetical protein
MGKIGIYCPCRSLAINPDIAVDIYCGLTGQCFEGEAKRHLWKIHINCRKAESFQILAATLVSQFCSSTYQWICLRRTGIMS